VKSKPIAQSKAVSACLLLGACSSMPPPRVMMPQASLLVRCPSELPPLTDGTAGDVLQTMAEWAAIYHDCRILHDGLVGMSVLLAPE
jgi:hypothetical protein